jgi:hypothetical protein
VTVHEGSLLAADAEQIEAIAKPDAPLSPLVAMLGLPTAEIDILGDDNAASYWERSDQFDMALDLTAGRRGIAALAVAMERWIAHMLAIEVAIEPLIEVRDVSLAWYVGFDAEATSIGDALWNGEEIDEERRARVVGLFRLSFRDPGVVLEHVAGEPVYVIVAMSPDRLMRAKPQNLLTGLPIKQLEAVE